MSTRVLAAVVVLGLAVLALPSQASAEWYFTKRGAEKATRDWVPKKYKYNYTDLAASCRPQGQASADSRFKYHRWTCGWAGGATSQSGESLICSGQIRIIGSRARGAYYAKAIVGERCKPE